MQHCEQYLFFPDSTFDLIWRSSCSSILCTWCLSWPKVVVCFENGMVMSLEPLGTEVEKYVTCAIAW